MNWIFKIFSEELYCCCLQFYLEYIFTFEFNVASAKGSALEIKWPVISINLQIDYCPSHGHVPSVCMMGERESSHCEEHEYTHCGSKICCLVLGPFKGLELWEVSPASVGQTLVKAFKTWRAKKKEKVCSVVLTSSILMGNSKDTPQISESTPFLSLIYYKVRLWFYSKERHLHPSPSKPIQRHSSILPLSL